MQTQHPHVAQHSCQVVTTPRLRGGNECCTQDRQLWRISQVCFNIVIMTFCSKLAAGKLTALPDVLQVEGGSQGPAAQSAAAEAAAEGDGASPSGDDLRHGHMHQVGSMYLSFWHSDHLWGALVCCPSSSHAIASVAAGQGWEGCCQSAGETGGSMQQAAALL